MSIMGSSLANGSANRSPEIVKSQALVQPELRLWQAILTEQVHDLFSLTCQHHPTRGPIVFKSRACEDAETWVGAFPSQNFNEVCMLAGLDPVAVHERLRRILSLPDHERAKYSFRTMSQDAGALWEEIAAYEREETPLASDMHIEAA